MYRLVRGEAAALVSAHWLARNSAQRTARNLAKRWRLCAKRPGLRRLDAALALPLPPASPVRLSKEDTLGRFDNSLRITP